MWGFTGRLEPRRQEVRFQLERPLHLEPGWHDGSEEGGRRKGGRTSARKS